MRIALQSACGHSANEAARFEQRLKCSVDFDAPAKGRQTIGQSKAIDSSTSQAAHIVEVPWYSYRADTSILFVGLSVPPPSQALSLPLGSPPAKPWENDR
jgi:hypothetical protein